MTCKRGTCWNRAGGIEWSILLLLLLPFLVPGGAILAQSDLPPQQLYPLEPTSGKIDDRGALAVFPATVEGGRFASALALEDCRVHLTRVPDRGPPSPGSDLTFPCMEWFLPPARRLYLAWVEGDWKITPFSGRIPYSGRASNDRGVQVPLPVTDAGRVTVAPWIATEDSWTLRLFRAESRFGYDGLSRAEPIGEVGGGVLMPAGQVVAGLWDEQNARYLALSRPFKVTARETIEAPLRAPGTGADVFVRLRRAEYASRQEFSAVQLSLVRDEVEIPADLVVPASHSLFAAWYRVEPGEVELRAESETQGLPSQRLELPARQVTAVEGTLQRLPLLDVEVAVPSALDDEEGETLTLELHRMPSREAVARHDLRPGDRLHRFDPVPLSELLVVLETAVGEYESTIDVSNGEDGYLLLEPSIAVLSGTVHLGDDGHPATLRFHSVGRSSAAVESDEEGRYEAILPTPVRSVEIELAERKGSPWVEFFPRPIDGRRELDFHLSAVEVRVRVTDATTGEPIPGATVVFRTHFVGRDEIDQSAAQHDQTDAQGEILLPPLREGLLEVRAEAAGYYSMNEPIQAPISDATTDQTVEVTLTPAADRVSVQLRLPGGVAAVGAQVLVVDSLATGSILLSDIADAQGRVKLPPAPVRGTVLVRHPEAAFLLRDWQPDRGDEKGSETWTLTGLPPQPLRIQLVNGEGNPYPRGQLALWIQGRRVSGSVLSWLTSGRPMADLQGSWSANNLPTGNVEVLAWAMRLHEEALRGGLDAFATRVPYPWPDVVEVEVLE